MAKNIIILLFRRGLGALVSILGTSLIVKNLVVEDYGVYAIFLNIITLASTFSTLGIDAATGYVLQNKKYKPEEALVNTFILGIIISVISFFIFLFLFYQWNQSDLKSVPDDIKMYMAISSVGMLLANILFSILMGKMEFKAYSVFTLIPNLSLLILIFVTIRFFKLTLKESAQFFTLGYVITDVSLILYLIVKDKILKSFRSFNKEISFYILKYGFVSYLSNVITFLNYRVNIFIIGYYLGLKNVGLYSVSLVVVDFLWLLSGTMASITYPMFSNPTMVDLRKKMIPIITRSILLLTAISFFVFYGLSNFLIPLMFGKEFLVIKTILLILAPGVVLFGAGKIITADFTAQGKPHLNIYLNIIALVITLIGNYLFTPTMGINGAALASSLSFCVVFVICLYIYCRMTSTHFFQYLISNISDLKFILKARN